MLAIDEAKLPPPTPAVAAMMMKTQYGVSGRCTTTVNRIVGRTSIRALNTAQLRPPNFGTANVYGRRSSEPTRLGTATSQNSCWGENVKPTLVRSAALTLHKS